MDAPDEMVEAVAEALRVERRIQDERDDPYAFYDYWPDMARAALAVPALAEVIARDAKVRELAEDIVWLAKLAQGSSWPGEMAERVEQAANRVIREYGSDADRAALEAVAAMLRDGEG